MPHGQMSKVIRDWFSKAKGAGMVLPNGWFGRPYDNQHELTYIEQRPHTLLLELDDQLLLVFTELQSVDSDGAELVLARFAQCVFDWQEYATMAPHATVYRTGEVRFVPPVGLSGTRERANP